MFHKVKEVYPLSGMRLGVIFANGATKVYDVAPLRKAISYGKLVSGVDARKYGKQWIVTEAAMRREYADPVSE